MKPTTDATHVPHDLDAEAAVLGAILVNHEKFFEVAGVVAAADFYRHAHRVIFHAMHAIASKGDPIDLRTLASFLNDHDQLEKIGGATYLTRLTDGVPRSTNAEAYAHIVAAKSLRAKLITSAHQIVEKARDGSTDEQEVVDFAQSAVLSLSDRSRGDFVTPGAFASETLAMVEDRQAGRIPKGLNTGWSDLDKDLVLRPGNLILVGGRPSMGKTAFALNLAYYHGKAGRNVALFSVEMTRQELGVRLLAAEGSLDASAVGRGELFDSDYAKLGNAYSVLAESRLFVNDSPDLGPFDLRSGVRRLTAKFGEFALVVVDYLQLMRMPNAENRNVQVSAVSRSLKLAARELNVPLVVLSQLSRDSAKKGDPPTLTDLRDSGSLEQDADVVLFVHRPEYYEPTPDNRGLAEIIIAKQRNGPTGKVYLGWQAKHQRFVNRYRYEEDSRHADPQDD